MAVTKFRFKDLDIGWDSLGSGWERLINFRTNHVYGSVRPSESFVGTKWLAVREGGGGYKEFRLKTAAKKHIEVWAIRQAKRESNPGRSRAASNAKWIPATAVRMLPGGKVQVKVPRGAIRNPKQGKTFKFTNGVSIVWSAVNNAWFVMWHKQLLQTFSLLTDAKAYAKSIGAEPAVYGRKSKYPELR